MTKEQIAEAGRTADSLEMEPSHPKMNGWGAALNRLLEERKRLLEALRAVEWTGGMGDQHCSLCQGYSRQWGDGHGHVAGCKLADAIAFAEEPVP